MRLIFEEIERALVKEQAPAPPAPPADTAEDFSASTGDSTPDASSGGDTGVADSGVADPAPGGDPGAMGGDAGMPGADMGSGGGDATGGVPGEEGSLEDDGSSGSDLGGGGGFGALGGGGGGFGGGGMGDDDGGDDLDGGEEESKGPTPSGEPTKDPDDPVGAAVDEATKMAEQTTEIQKIVNAVKASIQVNFSNYEEAWPIVEKLRETGDKTLDAVADRLSLFIAGVLEEDNRGSRNKGRTMKITKENLKEMIRAIVKEKVANSGLKQLSSDPEDTSKSNSTVGTSGTEDAAKGNRQKEQTPQQRRAAMKATTRGIELNEEEGGGTVQISESQLKSLVKEVVRRKLQETTGYVEQERMRQEMNMLALEFLEKLTQKLNIDAGSLSPEALETYKRIHKQLEMSVRQAAADMYQLGVVVSTAGDGSNGPGKPGV